MCGQNTEKSKKLSPGGNGVKDPGRGTHLGKKKEQDAVEAEEDGSQERLEEDTTLFRACDDREIEMNGLRKFSKNLKFEKPTAEDMAPVHTTSATIELATRLEAGGQAGESRQTDSLGS